jgi:hypothetical protein
MMRVPQGVLVAATDIGRAESCPIANVPVTRGMFPIAEDIERWRIVPRPGAPLALVLPFPGSSGITVAKINRQLTTGGDAQRLEARAKLQQNAAHEAQLILCGGVLMTYLTTWALWASQPDNTGRFLVTVRSVAELRGLERDRVGSYGRPMDSFKRDMLTLMNCGVSVAAEPKAHAIDPLIQRCEAVRGGSYYRHAGILIDTIRLKAGGSGGFAQVPMRAIQLGAHDARTVVGLAALWRPVAAATAWRGTLEGLASQLGVFRAATQRSEGRRYWPNLAGKIARVANDGGFGKLFVEGVDPGPQTTVVLTPSAELMDAYQRLRDVREEKRTSAHTANQEAAVRRLLPRAKKKRK